MTPERYTPEVWKRLYNPIANWDATFRRGQWDYLSTTSELPRYAIIAGFIRALKPTGVVLDAGCGEGILIDHLDVGRSRYVGFDLSETAIRRAQKRSNYVTLSVCSVDDFDTNRQALFDVVVFNEVLPHVNDPIGTLDRFVRSLTPDGFAIISLYQSSDEKSNARILTHLLDIEIAAGRYTVMDLVSVENGDKLKWSVYRLR